MPSTMHGLGEVIEPVKRKVMHCLSKFKTDGTLNNTTHHSYDGRMTVCNQRIDEKWSIRATQVDGVLKPATCRKCLEKLHPMSLDMALAIEVRIKWMKLIGLDAAEIAEHTQRTVKLSLAGEQEQLEAAKRLNAAGLSDLKIKLSPAEHKDVRIAAAERGITIADFLRESVLFCAGQAVNAYYQREIATKKPSRSKLEDVTRMEEALAQEKTNV